MRRDILPVARKELAGFFASPAAFLFLGAFLGVTLFVFFWVETFFARNIADVRPLFQWMPVLLIFLVAALTMRSWAEERRGGTLELLLTAPASPTDQVLGKFLGGMSLVAIALALTLPLPVTVSFLGPLDWGPVVGGYLAALTLAAAYVAIGLWVSSRTDNQIVSLILTVVIAGVFYLVGSEALTALFGHRAGELLRAVGAGSRFESITRGVLDLRDLYYYLSITAAFLVLNRLSLERLRWANNRRQRAHRTWHWVAGLLVANVLGANLWLSQVAWARADLTTGNIYTLSDATRGYLTQLQEPLLIRGYFSASTHPLLAPLVPQLRDLLEEYAAAGGDKVRVEFVDPHENPELEEEAGSKYGIQPVPFQTASKYQASVVNSYFDILVAYGDQYEVLNYRDLIDVKVRSESDLDVELKNPEYDITRAVRKVLTSYQGGGSPFEALNRPLTFTGYLSGDNTLPDELKEVRSALETALETIRREAGDDADQFKVVFADPAADQALASKLGDDYGFRPMITGLLDPQPFWFYLTLSDGGETVQVPLPQDLNETGFQRALESAVKRFSPGFLKTVAVLAPPATPNIPGLGGSTSDSRQFSVLREALSESARWLDTDLEQGRVPAEADLLMILAPQDLNAKQVFAIDQFLMQGGTVLLSTGPFDVDVGQSIEARKVKSGLEDWLAKHGLALGEQLVLDPQSGALPIPVERRIGGFSVREIRLIDYPYIADVRGSGLDSESAVTAGLGQLYVPWAVPIDVDADQNQGRKVTELLRSSARSWVSDSQNLVPDYRSHPRLGFAEGEPRAPRLLTVMVEGRFDSVFKGKPSPLLAAATTASEESGGQGSEDEDAAADGGAPKDADTAQPAEEAAITGVIDHSADSARLILVSSSTLFADQTESLISQSLGTHYVKPAEFAQNVIDWALEDQGLLGIRSRGHFARTLVPLERDTQTFWEYLNYGLAVGGLALVWFLNRRRRRTAQARYAQILQEV
jgi:ABC-2 type transport system permease protein